MHINQAVQLPLVSIWSKCKPQCAATGCVCRYDFETDPEETLGLQASGGIAGHQARTQLTRGTLKLLPRTLMITLDDLLSGQTDLKPPFVNSIRPSLRARVV